MSLNYHESHHSQLIIYQTDDGQTRIDARFEGETAIENSVIRNFRITAADGKTYDTKHYDLI